MKLLRRLLPITILWSFVGLFLYKDLYVSGDPNSNLHYKDVVQIELRYSGDSEIFLGYCSGSLIAKDIIITAAHCLNSPTVTESTPSELKINTYILHNQERIAATRYFVSSDTELAFILLERPIQNTHVFKLSDHKYIPIGTEVVTVGFPAGIGRVVSPGHVTSDELSMLSSWDFSKPDNNQFQVIDTHIAPGSSGGPVLTKDGKIVGIISWGVYESIFGMVNIRSIHDTYNRLLPLIVQRRGKIE